MSISIVSDSMNWQVAFMLSVQFFKYVCIRYDKKDHVVFYPQHASY